MIVIAIIHNPKKLASKLTKYFTGSTAYHIGFVDTENNKFYDMNLLFRRRIWPYYTSKDTFVEYYSCPVPVSRQLLEETLERDEDWYGFLDYMFFAIKKLFNVNSPSFKGAICSEKVYDILIAAGWKHTFKSTPSPADFEKVLIKRA